MSGRAYLDACAGRGLRLDLAPMRALMTALGHPERGLPALLVAGTNGKGSVVAYTEAVLRAAGLRTGRFTSPALMRLEDQLAIDGVEIAPRELDDALDVVRQAAETAALEPTPFEALTAAALVHFRRARVAVAVLEVGMGGRDDATNVVEPLASAIVSVALDHERYLGDTLAQIATVKAGVMRPARACVIGALPAEARSAVESRARALGARLLDALAEVRLEESAQGLLRALTPTRACDGLRALPGAHQRDNLRVALRLLEAAHEAGLAVDFSALPRALAAVEWPGRLQRLDGAPPLLLDGAHNPAGARALAAHLRGDEAHVLLFGAMRDKDIGGLAAALFAPAQAVVLTRADASTRAATPEELRARAGVRARALHLEADPARALDVARRLARAHGPRTSVVVAGSLALVGAILKLVDDASATNA